jgi:hypothetical protein
MSLKELEKRSKIVSVSESKILKFLEPKSKIRQKEMNLLANQLLMMRKKKTVITFHVSFLHLELNKFLETDYN